MIDLFCLLYYCAALNSNVSVLLVKEACFFYNFVSSMTGFAASEIQYRNDLSWSTLFGVQKHLTKSRYKRQINVVSNNTVQVCHANCSL